MKRCAGQPYLYRKNGLLSEVYRAIERGAVAGMERIENAFVKRFLLQAGESVADARIRLAHENKARIQRQAARLQA